MTIRYTFGLFLLLVLAAVAPSAHAQSALRWTMNETKVSVHPSEDREITGTIDNMTDSAVEISFRRYQDIPEDWQTSVCFGVNCYASFMDSASGFWEAHESRAFIFHVYTDASGGTIQSYVRVRALTGNLADTAGYLLEAKLSTSGVNDKPTVSGFAINSVYPNPVSGSQAVSIGYTNATGSSASLTLIDALGRSTELGTAPAATNGSQISRAFPALAPGAYMLVARSADGAHVSSYPVRVLGR